MGDGDGLRRRRPGGALNDGSRPLLWAAAAAAAAATTAIARQLRWRQHGGEGGGSASAEVAAVRRQRWRCGDGVPFARENSLAWKNSIVPQIVVPRIMPKPRRKIVLFEEVSALFEVLFGGTLIVEISTEKRSPTTFQYSCAATEKCIIILYTFFVCTFYPDNFG